MYDSITTHSLGKIENILSIGIHIYNIQYTMVKELHTGGRGRKGKPIGKNTL
jgi:hypothetical protein